jgi:hypothetical protein
MLSRRAFLAAIPAFAIARTARAEKSTSRIVNHIVDARGATTTMELDHAPFPAAGGAYSDSSVIAFVPSYHRIGRDDRVSVVVHFHGHHTTAERAIVAHQLREQLYESKQNAILLVPQLAVLAADSSCGKLETQGGFARMIDDAITQLFPSGTAVGRVCVSAHSGGWHAAARALERGGIPVRETYLFDSLYAETEVFRDWVIAGAGKPMGSRHKLVSYYTGGTTEARTRALFAELERAGVSCVHEEIEGTLSREDLTRAEAVSIRTHVAHGGVTSELNGLRDCLYASALRRNLKSSWFDAKKGARPLERRR